MSKYRAFGRTRRDRQTIVGNRGLPSSRTFHFIEWKQVIGTDEILQVAGVLMSDRLTFDTVCPNNHNQTVRFNQEEFEETLKSGALVFHCNTCDTDWSPSSEEIAKFRKEFSK